MKFMTMVTTSNPEQAGPPPPALMQAIMELGMSAGGSTVRDTGGMKDTGSVRVEAGNLIVDGPFAEAKELVGGYAIYELPSEADVVEYCRRFADLHREHWPQWEGRITIQELVPMGPPPA